MFLFNSMVMTFNLATKLYLINQQIQTYLELEGIKGQSVEDLSSVQHLLSEGTKSSYDNYVSSQDILPLSTLQGSLDFQLSTDNSSLWKKFVSAVNLGEHMENTKPKANLAPILSARVSSP